MSKTQFSEELLSWSQDRFKDWIQAVYDDPSELNSAEETRAWLARMERFAKELGLDFQSVVKQEATLWEQSHITAMTIDEWWND